MNILIEWAAQGRIAPQQLEVLGQASGVLPDPVRWRHALDRALLIGGALLLAAGLIFFGAANWAALPRWARFALAEVAVAVPALLYWRWPDQRAGRAALGFGVLAIGALLALYGQTYQTGADPWQLFAAWAVLALPWVWLARTAVLWLGWLALVDLALWRWMGYRSNLWGFLSGAEWQCWAMFLVQGAALLVAERQAARSPVALFAYGSRLLLYLATLGAATVLGLVAALGSGDSRWLDALAWVLTIAAAWRAYRVARVDIAALAATALSVIVIATALLGRVLDSFDDFGIWLLIALAVIMMTGMAGRWLLGLSREQSR